FWPMVFKNIRLFFLGSDDFPIEAKESAARDLNDALQAGWPGFEIGERVPSQRPHGRTNWRNIRGGLGVLLPRGERLEQASLRLQRRVLRESCTVSPRR